MKQNVKFYAGISMLIIIFCVFVAMSFHSIKNQDIDIAKIESIRATKLCSDVYDILKCCEFQCLNLSGNQIYSKMELIDICKEECMKRIIK